VALFLAGDMVFRRILRIGTSGYRMVSLVGALVSIPVGLIYPAAQLVVLLLVLVFPLSIEGYRRLRASGVTTSIFSR